MRVILMECSFVGDITTISIIVWVSQDTRASFLVSNEFTVIDLSYYLVINLFAFAFLFSILELANVLVTAFAFECSKAMVETILKISFIGKTVREHFAATTMLLVFKPVAFLERVLMV